MATRRKTKRKSVKNKKQKRKYTNKAYLDYMQKVKEYKRAGFTTQELKKLAI